jgi:hypothetical protein
MKKIERKLFEKEQLNEVFLGIAKAILGGKAKLLMKAVENDPGLANAVDRHAQETRRFRKYLEDNYGEHDPEEFAATLSRANARLDKNLKKK